MVEELRLLISGNTLFNCLLAGCYIEKIEKKTETSIVTCLL